MEARKEARLDEDLQSVGYLTKNASHFKALQVYMEHRYYGKAIPFGSMEEAMRNESTRGYFNSAQAIADYAEPHLPPILYFDDITPQNGYYSKVTKDFKEFSKRCYETIRRSWSEIRFQAQWPLHSRPKDVDVNVMALVANAMFSSKN
ncbi:unnamed protein product [Fraxinus pennsylvanica]|uniref:Uncharacterized protein n=1 Tax=Fraxinus pennsylvanica TaxID=56036 RepID=A0AAD1ZZC7_9LAMI|nr:unnamed protein product [Fraxinus pennsylvanica]